MKPGTPLVVCAKGIELGSGLLVTEVLDEIAPDAEPAVLSGPSFARDVATGLPTAVTIAARAEIATRLAHTLGRAAFRPYVSEDLVGVALGGAAKNVYAIACGMVEGAGLGESARAATMSRGFAELMRLGGALGARSETLMGLSGLGDLVLTATSMSSRNFALGHALGQGTPLAAAVGRGQAARRRCGDRARARRARASARPSSFRSPKPSPTCSRARSMSKAPSTGYCRARCGRSERAWPIGCSRPKRRPSPGTTQKKRGDKGEPWSGVRNFQAAGNMKKMKKGDLGFFYHTGDEKRIVGIVEVIGEYRKDPTDETGRFGLVDVKAVKDVPQARDARRDQGRTQAEGHDPGEIFPPLGPARDRTRSGTSSARWVGCRASSFKMDAPSIATRNVPFPP